MADLRNAINAANYVRKFGYKTEIRASAVIVFDPIHSDGQIVGHNEVRLRNMQQALKFVEERS